METIEKRSVASIVDVDKCAIQTGRPIFVYCAIPWRAVFNRSEKIHCILSDSYADSTSVSPGQNSFALYAALPGGTISLRADFKVCIKSDLHFANSFSDGTAFRREVLQTAANLL